MQKLTHLLERGKRLVLTLRQDGNLDVMIEPVAPLVPVGRYHKGALPHGVTVRTFNLVCRSGIVDGAEKDGAGWSCSVDAWRRARAKPAKAPTSSLHLVVPTDDEQIAEAALAGAGLRSTRGGR